ncbi:MAG: zinc ribbon domain-containing protein [Chloroflexi bacterium]|nr:zinc ribbon domain-containing protein [Chloroflexota bacterium]
MQLMIVFIALVLTIVAFAFITYPLFLRKPDPVKAENYRKLRKLRHQRDTARSAQRELETEFRNGNVNEATYNGISEKYKRKTRSLARDIGEISSGLIDQDIEKQVAGMRRRSGRLCPKCGVKCAEGANYCPGCGARMKA